MADKKKTDQEKGNSKETKKDLTSLMDLATAGFIADNDVSTESSELESLPLSSVQEDTQINEEPSKTEPLHTSSPSSENAPTNAEIDIEPNQFTSPSPTPVNTNFEDIRASAESASVSPASIDINPAFSLIASGDFSVQDKLHIRSVIKEAAIGMEYQDIDPQLELGKIFIPRISEFAAVYLANKLRDYCTRIEVGAPEEIYLSKTADAPEENKENKDPLFSEFDAY